ncbi:MAG: DUF4007 family protein, partial [Leptospira sp.]|nr:DUF4007 family protein [Leptospira sp.]
MKLQLRIGGHETFYPRERWLYKGITEKEFRSKLQFFGEEENDYPTDLLGVGVNMVKSIRYWILACGLVVREGSHDRMSDWGKEILKYDPYLDQPISYWIIHYRLVTNDQGPTSWKWFFSESDTNQFDKNRWVGECKNWMEKEFRRDVSERSIANDYQTMMGMYSWGEKKDHFYP